MISRRNFLTRLWTGDVSLTVTYWIFYVLARALIAAAVTAFNEVFSAKAYFSGDGKEIYLAINGVILSYQLFATIIVWRSAIKYGAKKESGWGVLATIIAVLGSIATIGQIVITLDGGSSTVENYSDQVRQINAALPRMIDKLTRLDAVQYMNGDFVYNYTLIGSFNRSLQDKIRPLIMTNACENAGTRKMLRNVNLLYIYRSSNGEPLARILVQNSDCV